MNQQDYRGHTALHSASRLGYRSVVDHLLRSEAQVDLQLEFGVTTLMLAAEYGQPDIVSLLLASGAAVDQSDKMGWTALHYAARHGQSDVVPVLLQGGADPMAKDNSGITPLEEAKRMRDNFSVSEIRKKGLSNTIQLLMAATYFKQLSLNNGPPLLFKKK